MSSRVGKQVRVVKGETGKAKLVRKVGYASKRAHLKAARLEKSWGAKSKGGK
jgi:hypothetical protein